MQCILVTELLRVWWQQSQEIVCNQCFQASFYWSTCCHHNRSNVFSISLHL